MLNASKPKQQKYNEYNISCIMRLDGKKEKGLRMYANLQRAITPQTAISAGTWDNDIRSPRIKGSNGRGFWQALPTRIMERHTMHTGWSLHHKTLIDSGPYAKATVRTPWQHMIELTPDHTFTIAGLLHIIWQQGITTPLGTGVNTVGSIFHKKVLGPL